jgi:hypothetical protein
MRNELKVRVVEHVDQENPHPHTRQREPYRFERTGTGFEFDHERFFREPEPVFPPAPAVPFDARIAGGAWTVDIRGALAQRLVVGKPLNPPVVTSVRPSRASFFSDGNPADGSARSPVLGPEIVYPLPVDLSSWLPAESRLSLFGRAAFGSMEVFGVDAELITIAVGPQLLVPILALPGFRLGASISAGPAYLHTGIGDALGFEGMLGLRGEVPLTTGLSFVALAEASLYASANVFAWGPGLSLGLTLSW